MAYAQKGYESGNGKKIGGKKNAPRNNTKGKYITVTGPEMEEDGMDAYVKNPGALPRAKGGRIADVPIRLEVLKEGYRVVR